MAYRRCSLPPLKLTRRRAFAPKAEEIVQRGSSDVQPDTLPASAKVTSCTEQCLSSSPTWELQQDLEEPTSHELESRAAVAGWERIRCGMLKAVTEAAGMPESPKCVICGDVASMRCQRCGPLGVFCPECFYQYHAHLNLFHIAEKYENGQFVPVVAVSKFDVRPHHHCVTKRDVSIHCLDEYGLEHELVFVFCECEPLAVTLARAHLWPATPQNPRYAFTFALLDWAEALLLECQVSLKDFCSALKFRSPFHFLEKRNVYSAMIDSLEEYRHLRHELRHMSFINSELDTGNVCPACPKDGGKVVYSMDALFGLPRKKSAGISHRDPLHGEISFCDQSSVDEFVADSTTSKAVTNDCNDFLAGSMLRSASRYRALDETAVFGYCCRHEFPGRFINLKHGERLAYPVWMLEHIIQKHSHHDSEIFVMYDIACSLFRHLQAHSRLDILGSLSLCLPTFHSYGHKVACQINFGPRRCKGIGLSDGETMERLWSYLRRFSRMTKEMRPSHRTDILTSALVFYGMKTKEKLGSLIRSRWERASKTKSVAEETLNEMIPDLSRGSNNIVDEWLAEESSSCQVESEPKCSKL